MTFYQQKQTSHVVICIKQLYGNTRKTLALITSMGLTKTISLSLNTCQLLVSSAPLCNKIKINEGKT